MILVKRGDKVVGDRVLSISMVESIEKTILNEVYTLIKDFVKLQSDKASN
jgi:hypothetical protein